MRNPKSRSQLLTTTLTWMYIFACVCIIVTSLVILLIDYNARLKHVNVTSKVGSEVSIMYLENVTGTRKNAKDAAKLLKFMDEQQDSGVQYIRLAGGDTVEVSPWEQAQSYGSSSALTDAYAKMLHIPTDRLDIPMRVGAADLAILNLLGIQASSMTYGQISRQADSFEEAITSKIVDGKVVQPGAFFPYITPTLSSDNPAGSSKLDKIYSYSSSAMHNYNSYYYALHIDRSRNVVASQGTHIFAYTKIQYDLKEVGIIATPAYINNNPDAISAITSGDNFRLNNIVTIIQNIVDTLNEEGVNRIILISNTQDIAVDQYLGVNLDGVDVIIHSAPQGQHKLFSGQFLGYAKAAVRMQGNTPTMLVRNIKSKTPTLIIPTAQGDNAKLLTFTVPFDTNGILVPRAMSIAQSLTGTSRKVKEKGIEHARDDRSDKLENITNYITQKIELKAKNSVGYTTVEINNTPEGGAAQSHLGALTASAYLAAAKKYIPTIQNLPSAPLVAVVTYDELGSSIMLNKRGPHVKRDIIFNAYDITQMDVEMALPKNPCLGVKSVTARELVKIIMSKISGQTTYQLRRYTLPQVAGIKIQYKHKHKHKYKHKPEDVMQGLRLQTKSGGYVLKNGEVSDHYKFIIVSEYDELTRLKGVVYPLFNQAISVGDRGFETVGCAQNALKEYIGAKYTINSPYNEASHQVNNKARHRANHRANHRAS